jgi:carbon-monoxide dehydrogenase large subunit
MGLAQIMAAALGVPVDDVDVIAGDSAISPYGGGAWASRGMAMGGEAALKAALGLRTNILALAGAITQADPKDLDIKDGAVVNRRSGMATIGLGEVGRIGYFRQDTLPPDFDVQLAVTRSHVANNLLYHSANGVTSVHLEVDVDTGFIKLLGIWAVDDCGRVINPMLVDEQVRGGIVHGLGAVLYEHCVYNELGQLQNGTLADYLVPMAVETPDMVIAHVESPERSTLLGAKGIGEAGTIGAMGAVWVAVNDALRPLGAIVDRQPFTPERILDAVRAARSKGAG